MKFKFLGAFSLQVVICYLLQLTYHKLTFIIIKKISTAQCLDYTVKCN